MSTASVVKFVHLVAGSTYITEKGATIRFMGAKGGHGEYVTSDEQEIKELRNVCKSPIAQLREVAPEVATEEVVIVTDPAITEAAADAAAASAAATDPTVAAAQNSLASLIAARK